MAKYRLWVYKFENVLGAPNTNLQLPSKEESPNPKFYFPTHANPQSLILNPCSSIFIEDSSVFSPRFSVEKLDIKAAMKCILINQDIYRNKRVTWKCMLWKSLRRECQNVDKFAFEDKLQVVPACLALHPFLSILSIFILCHSLTSVIIHFHPFSDVHKI